MSFSHLRTYLRRVRIWLKDWLFMFLLAYMYMQRHDSSSKSEKLYQLPNSTTAQGNLQNPCIRSNNKLQYMRSRISSTLPEEPADLYTFPHTSRVFHMQLDTCARALYFNISEDLRPILFKHVGSHNLVFAKQKVVPRVTSKF